MAINFLADKVFSIGNVDFQILDTHILFYGKYVFVMNGMYKTELRHTPTSSLCKYGDYFLCSYNALTNSCSLLLTAAHAKSSQFAVPSPVVAWQWIPTIGVPQLPCLHPYWTTTGLQLTHWSNCVLPAATELSLCIFGTDHTENTTSNNSSITACISVA
jgi:hypothetical protein